jgi:hypothetical protein
MAAAGFNGSLQAVNPTRHTPDANVRRLRFETGTKDSSEDDSRERLSLFLRSLAESEGAE